MKIHSQMASRLFKNKIPHIVDSRALGLHNFYSPGKLMLTGEYFVLDGAKALAVPTTLGQSLSIKAKKTFSEAKLVWRGEDYQGNTWLEVEFSLRDFSIIKSSNQDLAEKLQDIFKKVRELNIHFLREEKEYTATSKLEFPLNWGLGSSSTLLFNISQWAYISPFELSRKTFGGSGCDIAVAEAKGPVLFHKESDLGEWRLINLDFPFKDNLYFIHLDKKQNTRDELDFYYMNRDKELFSKVAHQITEITNEIVRVKELSRFNDLIDEHELLVSRTLKKQRVKDLYFSNFNGSVKSLGAWGGDFVLASSEEGAAYIKKYFEDKGFSTALEYKDIIPEASLLS